MRESKLELIFQLLFVNVKGGKRMNDYVYWTSYTWDLRYDISVPLNSFYY